MILLNCVRSLEKLGNHPSLQILHYVQDDKARDGIKWLGLYGFLSMQIRMAKQLSVILNAMKDRSHPITIVWAAIIRTFDFHSDPFHSDIVVTHQTHVLKIIPNILIALVALEHVYFMYIEMCAWETIGKKTFRSLAPELFKTT